MGKRGARNGQEQLEIMAISDDDAAYITSANILFRALSHYLQQNIETLLIYSLH